MNKVFPVLFIFTSLVANSFAQKNHLSALTKIQKNYANTKGFQGKFKQQNYTKKGEQPRHATGVISYQHPKQMRWEYDPPNEQTLIINSQKMWLYDPLLQNVTIRELDKSQGDSALLELMEFSNLTQNFTQRDLTQQVLPKSEHIVIELIPKKTKIVDLKFAQIQMTQDYRVKQLIIFNHKGGYQQFELTHIDYNPSFKDKFFEFQISNDIEVINLNE